MTPGNIRDVGEMGPTVDSIEVADVETPSGAQGMAQDQGTGVCSQQAGLKEVALSWTQCVDGYITRKHAEGRAEDKLTIEVCSSARNKKTTRRGGCFGLGCFFRELPSTGPTR